MGLLSFIVFGLIIGFVARAIMPGRQKMGLIKTALVGMGGSLVGGFLGSLLTNNAPTRIQAGGFIGSIIGTLIVLGILQWRGHFREV